MATLCRYSGGFQGRALPAFGERPCSQGLVSYTFCSAQREKGCCPRPGSRPFRGGKAHGFCEGMNRNCAPFMGGGVRKMKCSEHRRAEQEVYKAPVPPQRLRTHDPLLAQIVFHKQLACCAFQIFLAHSGKIKVPRRSTLTAFLPVRIIVAIDRKGSFS